METKKTNEHLSFKRRALKIGGAVMIVVGAGAFFYGLHKAADQSGKRDDAKAVMEGISDQIGNPHIHHNASAHPTMAQNYFRVESRYEEYDTNSIVGLLIGAGGLCFAASGAVINRAVYRREQQSLALSPQELAATSQPR